MKSKFGFSLTKTSELNGEYFIDDTGYASYADGDVGDYNHEILATEAMIGDEQLGERFGDYMHGSGQPLTDEERQAIDDNEPGFLDYMERGGEAREWVIEKHNWIRVHGENFQLMTFDQDAIKRIADFLGKQLMDEVDEETEVCIDEMSSGRMECFSPQEIFDAKQDPNKATRLLLKMRGTSSSSSAWGPETWRGGGEDKMMPIASSVKNWLTKISQSIPPSYTNVGHGYRWDDQENKLQEEWKLPSIDPVILWNYENGQIHEQYRTKTNTAHWDESPAKGRIETGTKRGSVTFDTGDPHLKQKILNALVDKYPGIKFSVYARGGPYKLQQYWEMIEQGKDII